MTRLNYIKLLTGAAGVAVMSSLTSLPALAQVNPNPAILNEPTYDGNPQTYEPNPTGQAGQGQVNPNPGVFNEPRYDGVPGATPAVPSSTPGLSEVNPTPSVLNEAPYNTPAIQQTQGPLNPRPDIFNEPPYQDSNRPGQAPGASTSPFSTPTQSAAASVRALDQTFAILAAQGNNAEIQTSQLALQRSNNDEVRAYAQRMIQEHTLANQRLQPIVAELGISLPSDVDPLNAAIAQRLAQLSDEEFDQAYMGAQTNAHLRTVALFRTQVEQGQDEALRSYAAQLLPNIEQHYEMASQLAPNYRADDILRPLQ